MVQQRRQVEAEVEVLGEEGEEEQDWAPSRLGQRERDKEGVEELEAGALEPPGVMVWEEEVWWLS